MYLNKDQILKTDDLKRDDVECPEWGGTVLVRELTARERDRHEAELLTAAQKATSEGGDDEPSFLENINARIAALGAIDEDGQRLFPDALDILALGEKAATVVTRIADKIAELSGMSADAAEAIKGNSEAVPSGGNLVWDLLARDKASPAFLRVAGAADKAAASTARANEGLSASCPDGQGRRDPDEAGHAAAGSRSAPCPCAGGEVPEVAEHDPGRDRPDEREMQAGSKGLLRSRSRPARLDQLTDSSTSRRSRVPVGREVAGRHEGRGAGAKAENADLGTVTQALTSVMASYGKTLKRPGRRDERDHQGLRPGEDDDAGLRRVAVERRADRLEPGHHLRSRRSPGDRDDDAARRDGAARHREPANLITNLAGQNNVASQALQQLGVNTVSLSKNLGSGA
jgi:hypothetical protein